MSASRKGLLALALIIFVSASIGVRAQDVLDGDPLDYLDQDRFGSGTLIAAMEALSKDYSTDATELVRPLMSNPDPDVARMAAWLLRIKGDSANAVSSAAEQLANQDNSIEARASAALALGVLHRTQSMAPLVAALSHDPAYTVRMRAAEALGVLHRLGAADALANALAGDVSKTVRRACAKALGSVPDADSSALLAALTDTEAGVRQEAAWALGRIKALDAVGNLVGVLQNDADCMVRAAAAWALGEIGDPIAKQALDAAKDSTCRIAAQSARLAAMRF